MALTPEGIQARRDYLNKWRDEHKDTVRKYNREYYQKHKEQLKQSSADYWNRKAKTNAETECNS